jgi:AcrR family transcriptional regulator
MNPKKDMKRASDVVPRRARAKSRAPASRGLQSQARPRRGAPDLTRQRLVAAAAEEFNRVGFRGTDSNRIARAAGYAPGTFYKHFADKRAILLAAYESWVTVEWAAIADAVRAGGSDDGLAARLADMTVALHRRWRGLRGSLRALVAEDEEARAFYREQRRRQLEMLSGLRGGRRSSVARRERDAVLLYTLERVCDAIADGELRDLGLSVEATVERLRALIRAEIA